MKIYGVPSNYNRKTNNDHEFKFHIKNHPRKSSNS